MSQESKKKRQAKARAAKANKAPKSDPIVHPNAAGIDIAVNSDLWVAVGEHASQRAVRSFSPLTAGLRQLCAWLQECQVDTVALEATGIYWLNIYLALREAGMEVVVVNPRCVKNLKRKSDISDCQWLRYLHSVGLLKASFVPPEEILALRTLSRHRENLTRSSAEHVQRLQKALDEMNLHLHHVITDITGATGRAILEAILLGERNPKRLAALRNSRVKAPVEKIEQALEGRWNEELLFVLEQEYRSWTHLQEQVAQCDQKLQQRAEKLPVLLSEEALQEIAAQQQSKGNPLRQKRANNPVAFAQWQKRLHMLLGVDLTQSKPWVALGRSVSKGQALPRARGHNTVGVRKPDSHRAQQVVKKHISCRTLLARCPRYDGFYIASSPSWISSRRSPRCAST